MPIITILQGDRSIIPKHKGEATDDIKEKGERG